MHFLMIESATAQGDATEERETLQVVTAGIFPCHVLAAIHAAGRCVPGFGAIQEAVAQWVADKDARCSGDVLVIPMLRVTLVAQEDSSTATQLQAVTEPKIVFKPIAAAKPKAKGAKGAVRVAVAAHPGEPA